MILWSRREFVASAIGSVAAIVIGGLSSVDRFGMFGKITSQPGQRDGLVQHLLAAAKLVGDAPGCELYVVYTSTTEPDVIWVTEAWRSKADHDASLSLPGVKELIAKARPLIAQMGEPIIATPVGGKGLPTR